MLAFAFVLALAAIPLYAAESYHVTVTLYPGDDAAAVAKRLAAMYRGELERPVEPQGGTFVMSIALGAAEAELLARDPHAAQVSSGSKLLRHSSAQAGVLRILLILLRGRFALHAPESSTILSLEQVELATTIVFTHDPVVSFSTTMRAQYISELRTAVNAVRTLACLPPATFTDRAGVGGF